MYVFINLNAYKKFFDSEIKRKLEYWRVLSVLLAV